MNLVAHIGYITRWAVSVVFIGFVTGIMAVMFPPLAIAGVVALAGIFLLWALPELRVVPEKAFRKLFFIMVVVQLCIPAYYAVETGYLPWISVRRLFAIAVIVLFSLTVGGSKAARDKIADTVRANRSLAFASFGFLVMIFLSIMTSESMPVSLKQFSDAMLNWYVPLLACMLIVRDEDDIRFLLKVIIVSGILTSAAGAAEFVLQRRFYFDIIPRSMLESMLANNPTLASMYNTSSFRNGLYRASSVYSVPLSFGEFAALMAPIAAYFVLHGRDWGERALGIASGIASLVAIFCSGARGAYTAVLVAMPVMAFLWTVRFSKLNPHSLVGAIMSGFFGAGTILLFGLVAFWPRLHNMVIGSDYEGAGSTAARFEQWRLAQPHILSNPLTGHGFGNSAPLVGYHMESGIPSIDSYVITLLVDLGVPGFLLFFGMIGVAIWTGLRLYLFDDDPRAAIASPICCSLIAFLVYRLALSQEENHTLLFLLIGIAFAISRLARDQSVMSQDLDRSTRSGGIAAPQMQDPARAIRS